MKIAIIHNIPEQGAPESDLDVLKQVLAVEQALSEAHHEAIRIPCTLNLDGLRIALHRHRPQCVFNLVESLGGTDRLAVLVPMLLESMGIPFTGATSENLLTTADKISVKRRLRELGIPTADWLVADETPDLAGGKFIVKPRYEHASIGIDDSAVLEAGNAQALKHILAHRTTSLGLELFAERFIAGREFNVSIITENTGAVKVLSPAEIDFSAFPENKPRIVGYDAKWSSDTFEYNATPRSFEFSPDDQSLLTLLNQLTEKIWNSFNLSGYARIDYRIDSGNNPFVLEINTNPCLSLDAGFAAALQYSGVTYSDGIASIVDAAFGNSRE